MNVKKTKSLKKIVLKITMSMTQRQDASLPLPPPSLPTNGSYRTPVIEEGTRLISAPEDVQLPSLMSSEEAPIPIPPSCASTPGREVSGQRCWTCHKVDQAPGSGASGQLFWRSSGLRGKDRARPYPAGHGEVGRGSGDWRL